VGAGHTMTNSRASEIIMEAMILTTAVRLHIKDFSVKKMLNMSLKKIKYFLNTRFVFNQINPTMTAIIIHKANIILVSSRGG
jgi:hypothetical protein